MFSGSQRFPPALTPVVGVILVSNILVYFVQQQNSDPMVFRWGLWPWVEEREESFRPWQLLTYGWLHGNDQHIIVNLFAVWMFGRTIEAIWGWKRFLTYYLVCVVGAGLIQLVVATLAARSGDIYPTIGASGGVFGLLLAFAMMFPNQKILLLIPPIPLKAKYFVMIYGAIELVLGITSLDTGVAHFAHLGGMFFGFVLIKFWKTKQVRQFTSEADYP